LGTRAVVTVEGAEPSQAVISNWWRQGMMGGAKANYEGIKAFSETDFTEDLKSITVPTYWPSSPTKRHRFTNPRAIVTDHL
ncbi:hypothetical protein ACC703_39495, partial [Rhizobium ruizarguesonis]